MAPGLVALPFTLGAVASVLCLLRLSVARPRKWVLAWLLTTWVGSSHCQAFQVESL